MYIINPLTSDAIDKLRYITRQDVSEKEEEIGECAEDEETNTRSKNFSLFIHFLQTPYFIHLDTCAVYVTKRL